MARPEPDSTQRGGSAGLLLRLTPFLRSVASHLAIPRVRSIAREYRRYAIYIGAVYALLVMFTGEMVSLGTWQTAGTIYFSARGIPWWDYPSVIIDGPGLQIQFPMLPTLTMLIAVFGVGTGTVVAADVLLRWHRARAHREDDPSAPGAMVSGVTPAAIGFSALGACCCVTCIGPTVTSVVAGVSGTSMANLLDNDWYISVFQIALVWASLVVQEHALRRAEGGCSIADPRARWSVPSLALRLALVVAGVTWSMAMFVEWGSVNPATATAAEWYHWIFEHQLLSIAAILFALLPYETYRALSRIPTAWFARVGRGALVVAAITWGIGVPAPLTQFGLGGFLNELLGVLGAPAAWGAVPPDAPLGAALLFHWTMQHLLLSGFALALALYPRPTVAFLAQSSAGSPEEQAALATAKPENGRPVTTRPVS